MIRANTTVVLLSGGLRSSYALLRAFQQHPPTSDHALAPMHVQYGQIALKEELSAARDVAGSLGLLLQERVQAFPSSAGDFENKPYRLVCLALRLFNPKQIYIGTRTLIDGEGSYLWCKQMSKEFEVKIRTPCAMIADRYMVRKVKTHIPAYASIFPTIASKAK